MITRIKILFGIKLSKEGKEMINEWLLEEFGSLYYAKKDLATDEALVDFIEDMLEEKGLTLNDLRVVAEFEVKDKEGYKNIRYCPHCGNELIIYVKGQAK